MAFEIDGVEPDGLSGWSVVVQGRAYEITDTLDTQSEELRQVDVRSAVRDRQAALVEVIADTISGRRVGALHGGVGAWPLDPVFVSSSTSR